MATVKPVSRLTEEILRLDGGNLFASKFPRVVLSILRRDHRLPSLCLSRERWHRERTVIAAFQVLFDGLPLSVEKIEEVVGGP